MSPVESFATEQPLEDNTAHPTQLGRGLEKVSQKKAVFHTAGQLPVADGTF